MKEQIIRILLFSHKFCSFSTEMTKLPLRELTNASLRELTHPCVNLCVSLLMLELTLAWVNSDRD